MSIRTWPSPPLKAQAEAPRRSRLLALSWALGCPPRPHAVSSVPRTSCGQISMHGAEWGCDSPARHSGPEEVGLGTQAFLLSSPLPGPLPAAWPSSSRLALYGWVPWSSQHRAALAPLGQARGQRRAGQVTRGRSTVGNSHLFLGSMSFKRSEKSDRHVLCKHGPGGWTLPPRGSLRRAVLQAALCCTP